MPEKLETIGKSSTGLNENLAALIAILFAPITSIIFFLLEKDSEFVKFHALQSGIAGVAIIILQFILGLIPIIGWIVGFLLGIATFVFWIILLIKSYGGEFYKLPIIGQITEDQLKK